MLAGDLVCSAGPSIYALKRPESATGDLRVPRGAAPLRRGGERLPLLGGAGLPRAADLMRWHECKSVTAMMAPQKLGTPDKGLSPNGVEDAFSDVRIAPVRHLYEVRRRTG